MRTAPGGKTGRRGYMVMEAKTLAKKELSGFLEGLRGKGFEIWGPASGPGDVEFGFLGPGTQPELDYSNVRLSPKTLAFPQSEQMFVFSTDRHREDAFILKEVPEGGKTRLAFGIRPCDARAFLILDKVFLVQGAMEDPYYKNKRQRTLLVGLGCNKPCSTCFCHWTGGGPFSKEGLDVLMTDLGESLLLEGVSEQGKSLISGWNLATADPKQLEQAAQLAQEVRNVMGPGVDPTSIRKKPLLEAFGDAYWEKVHEPCIKCGTCTYLCPTCSCFDIQDEVRGRCGLRGRNWDSCMFPLTTLHASGHNPRPTGKERFRQRFMHKLRYFLDDFDTIMCVGCGRCVQYCPVNIDIREIIKELGA